jgi:hypothetical protein
MIYSFYFEGGSMDGEVVHADFSKVDESTSRSVRWVESTLGGSVGLSFTMGDSGCSGPSKGVNSFDAPQGANGTQVYRVVYRDQNAGTVIIRCRHVVCHESIPPGISRIVFAFEGGFRDQTVDVYTIASSDGNNDCVELQARYLLTEGGAIGKRFGAATEAALQMLKRDGPEATRHTGEPLQIYEIERRIEDGGELRIACRFVRNE